MDNDKTFDQEWSSYLLPSVLCLLGRAHGGRELEQADRKPGYIVGVWATMCNAAHFNR